MRKLIRDNIGAVRDGRDYVAVDRARRVGGSVPTYTQDTVMTVPARGGDRATMREIGGAVSRLVLESGGLPRDEREALFKERLAALAARYAG